MPSVDEEDFFFRVVRSVSRVGRNRNMMGVMIFSTFRLRTSASYRSPRARCALDASRLRDDDNLVASDPNSTAAQVMTVPSLLWWALGTAEREEGLVLLKPARMCCTSSTFPAWPPPYYEGTSKDGSSMPISLRRD